MCVCDQSQVWRLRVFLGCRQVDGDFELLCSGYIVATMMQDKIVQKGEPKKEPNFNLQTLCKSLLTPVPSCKVRLKEKREKERKHQTGRYFNRKCENTEEKKH